MNINSVHSIVFSPCGGTDRVAKALGRDIRPLVREHNITLPGDRAAALAFGPDELVFFCFPVYGGRAPLNVTGLFSGLRGDNTPCALVAVYGNRAFEGALLDLHAAATANGFKPVAAVAAVAEHSSSPHIATGRPDADDMETLAAFGPEIVRRAGEGGLLHTAPGAYPEWKAPAGMNFFPFTDEALCTQCGHCADICPTGAIPVESPAQTDTSQCIVCAACFRRCPQKARTLGTPETREMFKPHLQAAMVRRDAELFV